MPDALTCDMSPPASPPWPAPKYTRRERLDVLAWHLSRTLALARALIQSGRTLDLSGIEDGVGLLCAQSLDLCDDDSRALLPALHDVLAQLDQLCLALHATPAMQAPRC